MEGFDQKVAIMLRLPAHNAHLESWREMVWNFAHPQGAVTIAVVGKYVDLREAYKSLHEALIHGGIANRARVNLIYISAEELGGLDIERFCEAVRAEGVACCSSGANGALHLHPFFAEKRAPENLPVSASIKKIAFTVPWFKHFVPEVIDKYIAAFKKVALHYKDLL